MTNTKLCAQCDEPIEQTGDGFADVVHADRRNDHPAIVKLSHLMDSDPFAGIDSDAAPSIWD
jgi:hypothetical protein